MYIIMYKEWFCHYFHLNNANRYISFHTFQYMRLVRMFVYLVYFVSFHLHYQLILFDYYYYYYNLMINLLTTLFHNVSPSFLSEVTFNIFLLFLFSKYSIYYISIFLKAVFSFHIKMY